MQIIGVSVSEELSQEELSQVTLLIMSNIMYIMITQITTCMIMITTTVLIQIRTLDYKLSFGHLPPTRSAI